MRASKILWLVYKRLRVSIGIFGFILMYGSLTNNLNLSLIFIGLGLAFIELFGATYNDYTDYEEDLKNNRTEKLTTSGFMSPEQVRNLSYISLISGFFILFSVSIFLLFFGIYYSVFLYLYSKPNIFLKRYNVFGYILVESLWLIFPLYLSIFYFGSISTFSLLFALFVFLQYVYILCQKDSTDPNDRTNLFLSRGWNKASIICATFAVFSSIFLFTLSYPSILLLVIWAVNMAIKFINVKNIWEKKINRNLRSKLILVEFLTPYFYLAGLVL